MMISKKYLYILSAILFALALPLFTYGNNLCTGDDATLKCLKENSIKLYADNIDLFWEILNNTSSKAHKCEEEKDVANFLSLIEIPRDGELAEYYSKNLENLCLTNTKCFLDALISLSTINQDMIIYQLANPLFRNKSDITEALNKYRSNGNYHRVISLYNKTINKKEYR